MNWALQHGRASQLPENVHILSFIQVIQQPLKLKCEDSYKRKVRLRVFQGSQDCSAVRAGERKPRPVFPTNPHDQNGIVKGKRTIFFSKKSKLGTQTLAESSVRQRHKSKKHYTYLEVTWGVGHGQWYRKQHLL